MKIKKAAVAVIGITTIFARKKEMQRITT